MQQPQICPSSRRRVGRLALVALVGAGVLGCATTTASPSERPTNSAASPAFALSPTATSTTSTASSRVPVTATPSNGAWSSLSWLTPSIFPDAAFIDDIVAWNGKLIAAGEIQNGTTQDAAVWDSSDGGTTWARLSNDRLTFADSRIYNLVTTPSGLVAWGTVGEPACTGQGEGMTCGPFPIMLWTSPDGATWKRIADVSMFKGATIGSVTFGAQGLVAVGDTGWLQPAIWVSATGAAWQRQTLPSAPFRDAHFSDVRATTSGYLVAGGIGGQPPTSGGVMLDSTAIAAAWWSPDGRTWTKGTVSRANGVGTSLGSIYIGASGMVAVGSATGSKTATAWTSTDGQTWRPIANAQTYAGVPTPAPGAPSIPSFTISDDGTHLVAVGMGDQMAITLWAATDGVTWRQLPSSGSTDSVPHWPADSGQTFNRAFVVPAGLIVIGQQVSGSQIQLWHATASW